jgi:hypothetical protein
MGGEVNRGGRKGRAGKGRGGERRRRERTGEESSISQGVRFGTDLKEI